MKVVLLGATRGMGRVLARQLAAKSGVDLFLLGRDAEELARCAADLTVRNGRAKVGVGHCDLAQPEGFASALEAAHAFLDGFDTVVVTAGLFGTQDQLEADTDLALRVMTVNYPCTVAFCEHARRYLLARGGGRLVVFSSVAGDRGRSSVGIYGSSKAGISHYLESLDHRYRKHGLVTLCVKPGFVRTGMTAGLKPPPFAGEPEDVASQVIAALERNRPLIYAPRIWALVMLVIRLLPRVVMRRLNF